MFWWPTQRLDRAKALVDSVALVDSAALRSLRLWYFWWSSRPGGLVVQAGARGADLEPAADYLGEEVEPAWWSGGYLLDVEACCWRVDGRRCQRSVVEERLVGVTFLNRLAGLDRLTCIELPERD
ncbi:hypothetical protein NDU88_006731 [Pleurodeles waltl]|uniref:Uncharacterized protein n=1 Tax=Pleurodeles waltl TaxID=8319 RepID=A0AAV7U0A7_PLEWA|nr:hypothetical protein NDU88_006731 [Pleurodeles waltl]